MADNEYETRARIRKATALATILASRGITSTELSDLTDVSWDVTAKIAGTRTPSAETRRVVGVIMAETERVRALVDPFEGIPTEKGTRR